MLSCLMPFPILHSPAPTKKKYFWKERMNAIHSNILFHILYLEKFSSCKVQLKFLFFLKVFPEIHSCCPPPNLLQKARIKPFLFFASKAHHLDLYLLSFCSASCCNLVFACLTLQAWVINSLRAKFLRDLVILEPPPSNIMPNIMPNVIT